MRDPHVEKLYYKVSSGERISYDDPEPISFSNYLGDFELRDDSLSVVPTDHFANKDDAYQIIEPFLRSWEIEADLKSGIGSIRFDFERAEVIDRNPPPPGTPTMLQAESVVINPVVGKPPLSVPRHRYPSPPNMIIQTSEVETDYKRWMQNTAYDRWIQYKEGKELLPSMAYYILTLYKSRDGQKGAAKRLRISRKILDKIGSLTAYKGDETTARKALGYKQYDDLSSSEMHWLEEAIQLLILRLSEDASGTPLTQITMSDLPPL